MPIDLTSPEELEWLQDGAGPPVKYSELVSEDELLEGAKMAIAEAMVPKLKPRLTTADREQFVDLETEDYQLIAYALVYLIEDETFETLAGRVNEQSPESRTPRGNFLEWYSNALADEILRSVPPIRLRLIAQYLTSFASTTDGDRSQEDGVRPLRNMADFERAISHLRERGIPRLLA